MKTRSRYRAYMKRDPWFPIAMMLVVVLAAWLGIAGPLFDDLAAKGIYEVLKGWQTAIVALTAGIGLVRQACSRLDRDGNRNLRKTMTAANPSRLIDFDCRQPDDFYRRVGP